VRERQTVREMRQTEREGRKKETGTLIMNVVCALNLLYGLALGTSIDL
jgi:hypothetical protein